MTSTVAASQIRVKQHGNAVIGERVDCVYDEKTGLIAEKTTTVAQVPTRDGGTAVLVGEQIRAAQVTPPTYTARKSIQLPGYHRLLSENKKDESSDCCSLWTPIVCGCFMFVISLNIMIAVGVSGLLVCQPMLGAGVTGLLLGIVILFMSCVCCACICNQSSFLSQCVFCLVISLLLLVFIVVLIPNTVFVAQNMDFIISNGTNYDSDTESLPCHAPFGTVALSVMGMSYVMLLLFLLICCCATLGCLGQLLKSE